MVLAVHSRLERSPSEASSRAPFDRNWVAGGHRRYGESASRLFEQYAHPPSSQYQCVLLTKSSGISEDHCGQD